MKKRVIITLMAFFAIGSAFGEEDKYNGLDAAFLLDIGTGAGGLSELGLSVELFPKNWLVGGFVSGGYLAEYSMSSLGFKALESLSLGLGLRTTFHWVIEPYGGVAGYLGGTGTTVPAEDDNIDNDNDGSIDEDGETKSVATSAMATGIAELGIRIRLAGAVILTGWQWMGATSTNGSGRNSGFFINFGIGTE